MDIETSEEMRLAEVARALKEALTGPKGDQVEKFISWVLKNFVKEKNLSYAIENDLDILTLALNHYGLGHSSLTPLFRFVMKAYWGDVESYLTNVGKVLSLLSEKPECAKILSTVKGRDYLNRCCKTAYDNLYDLIWLENE
jgi:uncharacterized membrane protein YfbV (UPF0208 family)